METDFSEFHELAVVADIEIVGACVDEELHCFSREEHWETDLLSDVAKPHDTPEVQESNNYDLQSVTPVKETLDSDFSPPEPEACGTVL